MSGRREIVIVGSGAVGVAVASSVLHGHLAPRLVLADAVDAKAEGEALDFAHAAPLLGGAEVCAVPMDAVRGGDLCVITAGVKQRPGETRMQLFERNVEALSRIAALLERNGLPRVALVVTNPVDAMTELLRRRWAPRGVHVLGSGTVLDTMRLRRLLSERLRVSAESIHAHVVGEHGDSSVCLLDSARVGAVPLPEWCARAKKPLGPEERAQIVREVRGAAYSVIERKGATSHAIGVATARIVRAIVRDERAILPVSAPVDERTCIGVPCVVGADGARAEGLPELSAAERGALEASLEAVRTACAALPG